MVCKYREVLKIFNVDKNHENRMNLCVAKKEYKKMIKKKKNIFLNKQSANFKAPRKQNRRDIWNYFKSKKNKEFGKI